jgi:hypothetical protein
MLYCFGSLVILFISGAYIGYQIAGDDWTLRGMFTFIGASVGSALWFVGMFAWMKWKQYRGKLEP